jgi:hypothetical protein
VLTGEKAAVVGMARPVVDAMIDVVVVVSFMMLTITTMPPVGKVFPITVPPIAKALPVTVLPTVKVTKVSIKIMVAVAEEENRRKAHVKR